MQKPKKRNDDEWLDIITKCRTSGMSDRSWCASNGIVPSTFYNAIRRLQKKACMIPEHAPTQFQAAQEVVPIDLCQLDTIKTNPKPGSWLVYTCDYSSLTRFEGLLLYMIGNNPIPYKIKKLRIKYG